MKIGAQLYTLRDYCKNLDGFAESLKRVADMGYNTVQVSATCEYEPEWLAEQLKSTGLECAVTHIPPQRIADFPKETAENHKAFGCRNIGIGYYDIAACGTEGFYKKFIGTARVLRDSGCYLLYHNHDMDFRLEDGRPIYERIVELFAPEELGFIVDTYWIQAVGGDPAAWIDRLSGRAPCVHFKDMQYGPKMAPVGDGNMNFPAIAEACVRNRVEHILVEQDNCYGDDPFDCMKKSLDYIWSLGL